MGDVPEMVLKVAVAISGTSAPPPDAIRRARAAIRAMHEPTIAMLNAVPHDAARKIGHFGVYQTMINAALASQGNGRER